MRRLLWLLAIGVIATSLVVASCQPAGVTTTQGGTTVKGTAAPTKVVPTVVAPSIPTTIPGAEMVRDSLGRLGEKPQYGGELIFVSNGTFGYDPVNVANFFPTFFAYEPLVWYDWKRGPSGTNEILLDQANLTLEQYVVGALAESWKVLDLRTVVYNLRKGVRFMDKPPTNGREMTSDDVVFSFNRDFTTPTHTSYGSKTIVTAIDKYTVKLVYDQDNVFSWLGGSGNYLVVPRDMVEAKKDLTDWKNMCGTGPYVVSDVVPASSLTYKKNPNYWEHDPLHPENQLPYVDSIRWLVIIDPATIQTAMRVGKIDSLMSSSLPTIQVMKTTAKQLVSKKLPPFTSNILHMNTKKAPYNDVKVRQALAMAIDYQKITNEYFAGDATLLNWPQMASSAGAYIPLEQLPANLQELYSYNPTKAKQLLAQAGFPQGFKANVVCRANDVELMSIVKNYWADIGVTMEMSVVDSATWAGMIVGRTFPDISASQWGNSSEAAIFVAYGSTDGKPHLYNYSDVVDNRIIEASTKYYATLDPLERTKIVRDLTPYLIENQWYTALPTPNRVIFWQPWVKQYNGEYAYAGGISYVAGTWKYTWVDRALKVKLGFAAK